MAQDKAAYEQRSVARFDQQFASLDCDRNAEVSRAEAHGNVDLTAVDIDRNGVVTKAAVDHFLTLRWGAAREE